MADEEIVSSISGLNKTIQKVEEGRQAEADKVTKDRKEEIQKLVNIDKEAKANGVGNRKEAVQARAEIIKLKNTAKLDRAIDKEVSQSIADGLGISVEQLQLRKDQKQQLDDQKKGLDKIEEALKSAGVDPAKNADFQKRTLAFQNTEKAQQDEARTTEVTANEKLEAMKTALEANGQEATDSAEYNKLSYEIQKAALADRLKNADNPAARKEIQEKQQALEKTNQGLLGKMAGGIGGLFNNVKDAAKDKAKSAKKGIMGLLQGTLVAGFALAAVAFLNSKYWDQTKKVLIDDVLPALVNIFNFIKDVIVPPLVKLFVFIKDIIWPIIRDSFIKQWESIKLVFAGIGEAFDMFSEGDILGGVTKLFGSLGTFFIDTIDNIVTTVFNIIAAVFGLEGTDSVGGSIMKFFTDTKNYVVKAFDDLVISVKEFFDFSDIFEGEPFDLSDFLFGEDGIISKAIQAIKDIFPSFADLKAMMPSASGLINALNPFSSDDEGKGMGKAAAQLKYGDAGYGRGAIEERGFLGGIFGGGGETSPVDSARPKSGLRSARAIAGSAKLEMQLQEHRLAEMREAKLAKTSGAAAPIVVNAPSTNVNSNSNSSVSHMNTPLTNNNPTVNAVNFSF
jgi:hypothetical protein